MIGEEGLGASYSLFPVPSFNRPFIINLPFIINRPFIIEFHIPIPII